MMPEAPFYRTNGRIAVPVALVLVLALCLPLYAQSEALAPGDWIRVEAKQVPGLSGRYQVNEDGFIDFPVVGPLQLKGISPQALKQRLADALVAKGYQRPIDLELAVIPQISGLARAAEAEGARPLQIGDLLAIDVAGEPMLAGNYTVQPPGVITLPMVGELHVAGLTAQDVAAMLTGRLARYVVEPMVRVTLASAVPSLVHIVGQVSRPGLYPLDQARTALALLAAAGGVLPNGDLSAAMVFRDGEPQKLAPAGLLEGRMLPKDVTLQAGDTLVVPERLPERVFVVGAVHNPGAILLEEADDISRAILLLGGPTEAADTARVYILRGTERIDVDLRGLIGDTPEQLEAGAHEVPLQADDVIVVPPGTGQEPVYVMGAVREPGPKLFKYAGTLSRAIVVSQGTTEQADLNAAYIVREGQRIEADLEALLDRGDKSADATLRPGDAVVVPSAIKQIYVVGQVAKPGSYPSEQAKTLLDLWALVGSALPDANLRSCSILRAQETISVDIEALINQGDMSQNLALKPGDKLIVPEILERVYVLGQVGQPGPYPIKEGETLMDILGKAGGTTALANIDGIALMRRNPIEDEVAARPRRPERTQGVRPSTERTPRYRPGGIRARLPQPEEEADEEPVGAQPLNLRILAAADWEDVALRPQPGDVIYVPASDVRLTRSDYQRVLIGIVTALLFRR